MWCELKVGERLWCKLEDEELMICWLRVKGKAELVMSGAGGRGIEAVPGFERFL